MRSIIIADNQTGRRILVVITITEPSRLIIDDDNGLADFQQCFVGKAQPDSEVSSIPRKDFLLVALRMGVGNSLDQLVNLAEIFIDSRHPAATSLCSNSSLSCR